MTSASKTDEFVLRDVHNNLIVRLEHTVTILESQPLSDEDVHTIRKELKRARASLRFLREALGVTNYRRINRTVRDAARPLTPVRDAKVLQQTLNKVIEKTGKKTSLFPLPNKLRQSLQQDLHDNRTQLKAENIAAIRSHLNSVKRSLQDLSNTRLEHTSVDVAIKRAHKKARKAFKAVKRESSDDNLHEWRKQVKYEYYQLELLAPLKPKRIGAIIQQAHKLSDYLGDDHDLTLLHARIATQAKQEKVVNAAANSDALLVTLKAMRHKLQKKARRLGKPLYAGNAKRRVKKSLTF